ncbi:putative bifunctional diguanylate cyclase/phosphodiesterase [Granulicella tundricola]|uniref:putative bifunctional diguanylate cyclase/phosphodiesterase n=1 Tax=Granulicella tundricola TaxID=940615 RepID=UPI0012F911E3|nr:bifunctional diguanylate cyclase/phosphodiesterase [Granulicella tundricola]
MPVRAGEEGFVGGSPGMGGAAARMLLTLRAGGAVKRQRRLLSRRELTWVSVLVGLAVLAQVVHTFDLLFVPRPLWISNGMQVLLPVLALTICLVRRGESGEEVRRSLWTKLAAAFVFWTVAELLYLAELYVIPKTANLNWPDDVLWLLFALPILMVTSGAGSFRKGDARNWVSGLDHGQAFLFFFILLSSVFFAPHTLPFTTAYNVQNLTLVLSCVLRLSSAETMTELGFYGGLGVYLLVYAVCAGVGNALQARGMGPGSMVDIFWSLPITIFCVLAGMRLSGAERSVRRLRPWARSVARLMQGVSALGLAIVSVGAAAAVMGRHPVLGYMSLVGGFGLFALRTVVRELQSFKANDQLRDAVLRDHLTGLGNRALFREHVGSFVTKLVRPEMKVALMFVDLDRFKAVNDELGHGVGDRLLIETAGRLERASRKEDLVCRLGGDEFVVAMVIAGEAMARNRAEDLLDAIREPFAVDGRVLKMTASIGVVLGDATDDVESLLRKADGAMYSAKKLGKDQAQVFDVAFIERMNQNWMLEQELQRYLEEDAIQVAFQPIYSVTAKRIVGVEALARWSHAVRGNISPGVFIPIAEEAGLIGALGAQVMRRGCREVAAWNEAWGVSLFLSVNVSAKQFADAGLLAAIHSMAGECGLGAELIHLEITESVLLMDDVAVERTLMEARGYGMGISLDDFGTGYSSLSYLLNLPVDEIKIDRSFINDLHLDPRRVELVRAVLTLGQTLGKRVVAEGVEREDQLEILHGLGCEFVQGYLISRPLESEAMNDLLGMVGKARRDC